MATEPSRLLNAPWCWEAMGGGPLLAQMPDVVHLPGYRGCPQPTAFTGSPSVRGNQGLAVSGQTKAHRTQQTKL